MPGSVLCEGCASSLPFIDLSLACPRCGAPFGRTLCTECPMPGSESALLHPEEAFPFTQARAALSFEDGARRIISTYKDSDELRLDAVIASLLCTAIRGRNETHWTGTSVSWGRWIGNEQASHSVRESSKAKSPVAVSSEAERSREIPPPLQDWSQWADALVYVPASPEALLRRGFDHMERVAEIVARRTGMALVHALASCKGARDQRELGRGERLANRSGSFSLAAGAISDAGAPPRRIVLIDDVFTTGATLSAAAHVLLDGGAHEIRTVTCCRVW
ncbi:MAG: hypothetical protein DBY20_08000 [Coriobacteriia bacterium]|nr:MAG: hypothetical protein DBY20_08000 [Coriobacteriia bacterium]